MEKPKDVDVAAHKRTRPGIDGRIGKQFHIICRAAHAEGLSFEGAWHVAMAWLKEANPRTYDTLTHPSAKAAYDALRSEVQRTGS